MKQVYNEYSDGSDQHYSRRPSKKSWKKTRYYVSESEKGKNKGIIVVMEQNIE